MGMDWEPKVKPGGHCEAVLAFFREQGYFLGDLASEVADDEDDPFDVVLADAHKRRVPYTILWGTHDDAIEGQPPGRALLSFDWHPLGLPRDALFALLVGADVWIHRVAIEEFHHQTVVVEGTKYNPRWLSIEMDRAHAYIATGIFVKGLTKAALSVMRLADEERAKRNGKVRG